MKNMNCFTATKRHKSIVCIYCVLWIFMISFYFIRRGSMICILEENNMCHSVTFLRSSFQSVSCVILLNVLTNYSYIMSLQVFITDNSFTQMHNLTYRWRLIPILFLHLEEKDNIIKFQNKTCPISPMSPYVLF